MYVPAHFAGDEQAVQDLLTKHGAADLVTMTADGLMATMLPFVHDRERNVLLGHLARNNEQWQRPVIGDALVIMRGPDAYVSPTWYPSKQEHGRVVPTWNYITAHVHGTMTVYDDPDWVEGVVRRLSELHEAGRPEPWSVDDAPVKYVSGQLRAVVGIEIAIKRIEAKFKLSQNRPEADIDGVIDGLHHDNQDPLAEAVARYRP
ncbi:FMN-binding negative transcriptional regulator [Kribbella sp. NPDC004536]|uniref:FMN-binding negative transcriptional regulator n=1 Tax=Kribbella sp. NPDC004536 TaxID=3364106 RepID=UPI0036C3B858